MPNQPQATNARSSAGIFAPQVPKLARQYTGKGMPYFVPACAFRIIGTSTTTLPRNTVSTACHQFIPWSINPDASMYVGMQADIEIHSAAMLQTVHFRCASVVGARSLFHNGDKERSSVSSTASGNVRV